MNWIFGKKNAKWLVLLTAPLLCASSPAEDRTSSIQESLALRRIAEYWKEADYASVKRQIGEFVQKHEHSAYLDHLYAMQGDICFKEKDFQHALDAYEKIHGEEFLQKTTLNHLQALFELQRFKEAAAIASDSLTHGKGLKGQHETIRFLLAESLFRLASNSSSAEKKLDLMTQALPHYKMVLQTQYKDYALFPLAETYKILKDYPSATSFYLALAAKYPEKSEESLFRAALLQVNFSKNEAAATFEKVYQLNGKRAKEAAINQMTLLFHSERYKDLVVVQKNALKHIPADYHYLMQYYVGKSLFELKDYQNAVKPLAEFLQAKNIGSDDFKNALLCLVVCAHEQRDFNLYDRALKQLKTAFPEDAEIAKALLMHAQDVKEAGNISAAQADLKEILSSYPDHPSKEALLYDYALLHIQTKDWPAAEDILNAFLKQYPGSSYSNTAWRHLLTCAQEELKEASSETLLIQKQHYADVLAAVLDKEKILSGAEKQQALFAYSTILYELEAYDDALDILEEYVKDYSKHPTAANANFMIALCHQKSTAAWPLFVIHAEKALALNPDLPNKGLLHLQLYNAYLTLTEQQKEVDKSELMEKAADHLYQAVQDNRNIVRQDNLIWLAQYYYNRAKPVFEKEPLLSLSEHSDVEEPLHRSAALLEKLLGAAKTMNEREAEIMKLAEILTFLGEHAKKAALLEAAHREQSKNPKQIWKWQRQAFFELGKAYLTLGKKEQALETFESLVSSSTHVFSYYAIAAQLEGSRLKYSMLKEGEKEGSPELTAILDSFKDLQIKRKLLTEPLHLEAALEYAFAKSALAPEQERAEACLHLLGRVQEEWTSSEDPLAKEYFAATYQFPEKKQLVQLYLQFIDAEMYRLKSQLAKNSGEKEKSKELAQQAANIYENLLTNALTLSPSLVQRSSSSMEQLKKSL